MRFRSSRTVGLALWLAPALALASAAPAGGTSPNGKTHTVLMKQMKYGPLPQNVKVGDRIIWKNADVVRHTATARDGSFNVDLPARSQRTVTVRKPGTIPFYCTYHPAMKGALIVRR